MPFDNKQQVHTRLDNPALLTRQDIDDLNPWLGTLEGGRVYRIFTDLALQNIAAVQSFDASSAKLSRRLLWLTAAIVFLTVILAIPVVQPWFKHVTAAPTVSGPSHSFRYW
jgi:hypothetical protein